MLPVTCQARSNNANREVPSGDFDGSQNDVLR